MARFQNSKSTPPAVCPGCGKKIATQARGRRLAFKPHGDCRMSGKLVQTARAAFTLVETLIVLAILLVLTGLGIGSALAAHAGLQRNRAEETLRKVAERLDRSDQIVNDARDWTTPTALLRLAGGNARRAEVLKVKYCRKWSFPQDYAEVTAFVAESRGFYAADGYPFLLALRNRLAATLPGTPDEQNAACLAAIFAMTHNSSEDELAPSEQDGRLNVPLIRDPWGTPLRFRRLGANLPLASPVDPGRSFPDPDDPEQWLVEPQWWAANGAWFVSTFGYDPNAGPVLGLGIMSAGGDRSWTGTDDNLDSYRQRLRVGGQQ